jgi:hypothetical protein
MPTPTIPAGNLYFNATLWTGTGVARTITNGEPGASFQSDMVWIKARNQTYDHQVWDIVRGPLVKVAPNSTAAESSIANSVTAFNSNGFSLGDTATVNLSGGTFVGWNWKAGGAAVTNTAGTISAQVSANTTAGFSVVTWTAPTSGSAPFTFGHGLGVAPAFIILKTRNTGGWNIYHQSLGNATSIQLNTTGASFSTTGYFNSTSPTSSVVTVGSSFAPDVSASPYVAYCWAQIAGYSAFGSYTGNGSADGPFVYLGFRPRFLMIKRTDTGGTDWVLLDSSRDPTNVVDQYLAANLSGAETVYANDKVDFLSNGFKQRGTASGQNANGGTYIYMAFAENPFKYANAR